MALYTRTQNDGTWIAGYEVTTEDWEDLFRKVYGGINGDRGGTYRVNGVWTIAGSGIQCSGPLRLTYGGQIVVSQDNSRIRLRNGAWPLLSADHEGATRTIIQSCRRGVSTTPYMWSRNHSYAGLGSVALACRKTGSQVIERPELIVPLRVHDGATLSSATFHFRVASARSAAPIEMPKFRILRRKYDEVDAEPLKLTSDGTGYASPTAVTSGATWYNSGNPQTFEYVCDQNHVIDAASYYYYAQIVEELGANDPNQAFDGFRFAERKPDVRLAGNQYILTGSPNIDDVTVADDDRVLTVASDDALETGAVISLDDSNGIWIVDTGTGWTRASDLDEQADFTPGFIVAVTDGKANVGSCWQLEYPTNTQTISLVTTGSGGVQFDTVWLRPAVPRGNIYHSIETVFAVSDMRFQ